MYLCIQFFEPVRLDAQNWGRLVLTAQDGGSVSMPCVVPLARKYEGSNFIWQYSVCHGCVISDYVVIRAARAGVFATKLRRRLNKKREMLQYQAVITA
ncbi:hypothetical protein D3C72_930090 [compost metagenome]